MRKLDEAMTKATASGSAAKLSCGHTQSFNPGYNKNPKWLNCEQCGSARSVRTLSKGGTRKLGDLIKRKDRAGHGSDKAGEARFRFQDVPGHKDANVVRRPDNENHFHIIHPYGNDVIDMYADGEGGKTFRNGRYGIPFAAKDHVEAAKRVLDDRKKKHGEDEARRQDEEMERTHGNEATGDITNLHEHMHVNKIRTGAMGGGWVDGTSKDGHHRISAQVFSEPSRFGIGGGRVSKLSIRDEMGNEHTNYDRGWDTKPTDPAHRELVRNIVRALGGHHGSILKSGDDTGADDEIFGDEKPDKPAVTTEGAPAQPAGAAAE